MRKSALTIFLAASWLFPAAAGAADFKCAQLLDSSNSVICAPPRGDLIKNMKDQYVCGPGQCVRNAMGEVICSAAPGGSVALDTQDRGLCVGGCLEATANQCLTPIPD